jgi:serine phosphatase RsbU (regulator of sigma subunit)
MDTSPGTWLDSDPVRADIIRRTGMHSLMIIPLQARGAIVGIATFVRSRNQVPFSRDDLLLAEELVGRSALNVDNAYRYTRERTTALALQKSLLPGNLPQSSAVEVASRYLPADAHAGVGGDWYDVIALPGARVALIVGDVAGHGIHAAATMGRLRTALGTLTDFDLPPHELLARLDAVASRLPEENPDSPVLPGMAATCACAVYNPVTRRCAMARAGHPPPAIVGADGTVDFPDLPSGAPIGLGLGAYESVERDLPVGSTIVLYTDGLVETRDADFEAGLDRLAAALTGPAPELEELCSEVVDTVVARPSEDDITLLTARTRELGPDRVATWKMSAGPETVGRGRRSAVEQLAAWGLDELADSVRLIVSELVTNAVVHGAEPFALRLIRDSTLVCEVSDTGAGVPRMRRAGAAEESGRGLFVVSELAQRWGSRFISAGKVTWAELALPVGAGGVRVQGSAARSG